MNIKNVEKMLRDYKRKKSIVETAKASIKAWEYALAHPEIVRGVFLHSKPDDCWIRKFCGGSGIFKSEVEMQVITEEEREDYIKQFIKDEESRIFIYNLEVEQIETSLNSLTKQEKYIIECKYFERMFWREIEINFNEKFRQQNYITERGLQEINKKALCALSEILVPYYSSRIMGLGQKVLEKC